MKLLTELRLILLLSNKDVNPVLLFNVRYLFVDYCVSKQRRSE